jgi:hypothetical protein
MHRENVLAVFDGPYVKQRDIMHGSAFGRSQLCRYCLESYSPKTPLLGTKNRDIELECAGKF